MHSCPLLCGQEKENAEPLVILLISDPLEMQKSVRTLSLRVLKSPWLSPLRIKTSLFSPLSGRSLSEMNHALQLLSHEEYAE